MCRALFYWVAKNRHASSAFDNSKRLYYGYQVCERKVMEVKRLVATLFCVAFLFGLLTPSFAHSGGTDAYGGHRDNKNASGLGYYHYHHGYSAHLHPNGLCPYAAGAASAGGSSSGSLEQAGPVSAATPPVPDSIVLTDAENMLVSAAKDTLSSGGYRFKLENGAGMSHSLARGFAKAAFGHSRSMQVYADEIKDNAVICRMSCDPAMCTKDIVLSASTDSEQADKIRAQFENWFGKKVMVVSCAQSGSFGMDVRVAIKANPSDFSLENLCFYAYDVANNSYSVIAEPGYTSDGNGYLYFTTSVGGDIVISSGPLRA